MLGSFVLAMLSALIVWYWRFAELARTVASVRTTAEIYEKAQQRMVDDHDKSIQRIVDDHDKSQAALLETMRAIIAQHGDMYRELSSRHSTLEERSTNHGQELRRIATNVHDLRTESRTALAETAKEIHADISELQRLHREDMARIQHRRNTDT
jgi:hypothetical protein